MTANQIRGAFLGVSALGFGLITFTAWGGNVPLIVMSLLGTAISFAMCLILLYHKKLDESFPKPLPGNSLPYAEEEHIYSKEAEMVRVAQLRHGIRTVNLTGLDFDLLEIAGEVVREAVAAERKLWMKENKRGGSR